MPDKFYDRNLEVQSLLNIYEKSKSQSRFTYIIGERRVGKTLLVKKVFLNKAFLLENKTLYFFVERKPPEKLLEEFTPIIQSVIGQRVEFLSISSMLEFLFQYSLENNITVIFDEFQNFSYIDQSIFSTIQKYWDNYKFTAKINLIVVGSIYSMMEKIFSSVREPLYGRATGKFHIKPFKLGVLKEILEDGTAGDFTNLLNLYTMFGGYAKYYEIVINEGLLASKPIETFSRLFLDKDSILKHEGRDLLIEEFGSRYGRYFSILDAVSSDKHLSNKMISKSTGINPNHVSTYLKRLQKKYNMIIKDTPLVNSSNKSGKYRIKNRFLIFWFKYIYQNISFIESEQNDIMLEIFHDSFQLLKGYALEDLVHEIVSSDYNKFPYIDWGKYWDKEIEIDILGVNKKTKEIFLGECKLKIHDNYEVVAKMVQRKEKMSKLMPNYKTKLNLFVAHEVSKQDKAELGKLDIQVYDKLRIWNLVK